MATGSVTGKILVGGVPSTEAAFNALVWLYNPKSGHTMATVISSPGVSTYTINGVPAGTWEAFLRPDPRYGFSVATHAKGVGVHPNATFVVVSGTTTSGIDIETAPGGFIKLLVKDTAGAPISGAKVLIQNPDMSVAGLPSETSSAGYVYLANVPRSCKLCVMGPRGYATAWYPDKTTFANGRTVILSVPQQNLSLTMTLPGS